MFLLNDVSSCKTFEREKFTIQNVSIKFNTAPIFNTIPITFTIQNVPIKSRIEANDYLFK